MTGSSDPAPDPAPDPSLDPDGVWRAIDAQRSALADLLGGLSDDEWCQPSLCSGWTVRNVAAHLTLQQLGPGDVLRMLGRWRGSMDRTIAHVARLRAAELTTARIVAEIRATIGSFPSTRSPIRKKVAFCWCLANTSSSCGVMSRCGPSSNVSANAAASVST